MRVTQPDSITKFIKSNELTFTIPVYQRNYVWKYEDCEKLFEDIIDSIQNKRSHYFGNIVYYQDGDDPFTGFTRYVLIDGQQRITSIMLLLAAIRDEEQDEAKKQGLTSTYLTNNNAEENFRVKLKQVETDRDVYEAIVEGRSDNILKSSIIYRNYNKFRGLVRASRTRHGFNSADLLDGVSYLNIIAIDLQSNSEGAESPQVIFESINATGEPLSTADLLRNFLLLEIGVDKQKEFYKNYWLHLEKNVKNENISDFIRRYITLKSNEDVKRGTEYTQFKKNYKNYFKDAEDALIELAKFSKYYRWIKHPEVLKGDKEKNDTSLKLQDVDDLRMLPATPVIMWLLEKADNGEISFEDVNSTLAIISSWSFRARVTGIIRTGEIGSILTTKILELLKDKPNDKTYAEYIMFELSNYRVRDIYPSNEMFKDAFVRYDFYKTYRTYVQRKLASVISNDKTEIELESIEHIMPQKIESRKWPNVSVSEHAQWINTVGNLVPLNMKDNSGASNASFKGKKRYLAASSWKITREIVEEGGDNSFMSWGIEEIKERAKYLANLAADIWTKPSERTRDIEVIKKSSKKLTNKFIEWFHEFDLPYLELDEEKTINTYMRFTSEYLDRLMPSSKQGGGWSSGKAYYYELKTDSSGWSRVALSFSSKSTTEDQELGQKHIFNITEKYPTENWKCCTIIGWTLEYEEGEDVLKDSFRKVLEEEIPNFEQGLEGQSGV